MSILITAIIFFYIGKYSHTNYEQQIYKSIKNKFTNKIKPGAISLKTPDDFEAEKSGDVALENEWIRTGKDKLIKQ